tara:strand:- start:362 stop:715 length:354 start_codon:yes stop_codon:yes gene_type:complete
VRYSEFIAESKDAESILANVMQLAIKTADEDGVPAKASWDELSRMLNAFGMQIDYDSFKEIYDKSQTIKNLTQDFDSRQIAFATKADDDDGSKKITDVPSTDRVNTMAKRAMKKRID